MQYLLRCLARGGLRGDERDAAVGLGLGGRGDRHRSGDARSLPLDFGAARAAGGRLRGPAVLPQRRAGACARARSTWTCRSRSASSLALGMSLVETARGAEHAYFDSALMLMFFLLLGRVLDAAMRRKTRSVAANLASLRATLGDADAPRRRPRRDAGFGAASAATASMCAPANGCRPTGASRRASPSSTTASSPARPRAARSAPARRSTPARSTFPARIEVEVAAAGAGHAARRDRAAAGERDLGEVALCPARRPRLALLCAGRASRGARLRARLARGGGERA